MGNIRRFKQNYTIYLSFLLLLIVGCDWFDGNGGDSESSSRLVSLSVSEGELSPSFSPTINQYTVEVVDETESISISATAEDSDASIQINGSVTSSGVLSEPIQLATGSNAIAIVTTAENGDSNQVNITVVRAEPLSSSDNADLTALLVSTGDLQPTFTPLTTSYNVSVNNETEILTVTPTSEDTNAITRVNGTLVTSGSESQAIDLIIGANVINVLVTAEDGETEKNYIISVSRAVAVSDNAALSLLTASAGELLPEFSQSILDYSMSVTNDVASTNVTATSDDQNATITVNGASVDSATASGLIDLAVGETIIEIVVLAADTINSNTYTLTITRDVAVSNNADLSQLTLSSGSLTPSFNSSTLTYSSAVDFATESMILTPTLADSNATMTINEIAATSGVPSAAIDLVEGDNAISIEVIAENGTEIKTYSVTVTRQAAISFAQQAYLKASDVDANDQFGYGVSLSGDTLAVAANQEQSDATGIDGDDSNNDGGGSGAVYIFTVTNDVWTQQAYIKSSNSDGDSFGSSVALDGDTLVVGAIYEDSDATGVNGNQFNDNAFASGAAYVFTRTDDTWTQQAYLKASNTESSDLFGNEVAVDGDTIVIGAKNESSNAVGINGDESNNDAELSGAVYVFTRTAAVWSQQAYIKASNTDARDGFGDSFSISGNTLAVGAWGEDSGAVGIGGEDSDNGVSSSGAVYIFTRDSSIWTQQEYIKASDFSGLFGLSVALEGNTLAVGAANESMTGGTLSGAAYVFTRENNIWSQQAFLKASNKDFEDQFGYSVALFGDSLVVGARFEDSDAVGINGDDTNKNAPRSGAAYVFSRSNNIWSQQVYVKASNTDALDSFGGNVTMHGNTIVIGSYLESSSADGVNGDQGDNSATASGAVYVFDTDSN